MMHGGDLADAVEAFGGPPSDWLDLSTGINPHPWPVPASLQPEGWTRLPSRTALATLLAAARKAYRVPDGLAIVAAPGTQALIQWLPRLAPAAPVAILGPTYAEHGLAWSAAGFAVEEGGRAQEHVLEQQAGRPGHLVVVNPNNPDGRLLAPADLLREARARQGSNGWLVVDESFADVAPQASLVPHLAGEPAVVLRSFGKFFGLPGLRLGFAIAPREIADRVAEALGTWAVSAPALAVGRAALADRAWTDSMRERLGRESADLDAVLRRAGHRIVGGTSLYRLAEVGRADALHARLAEARIWTRRFADRPALLRVGLPPDAAGLDRLAAALGRQAAAR